MKHIGLPIFLYLTSETCQRPNVTKDVSIQCQCVDFNAQTHTLNNLYIRDLWKQINKFDEVYSLTYFVH